MTGRDRYSVSAISLLVKALDEQIQDLDLTGAEVVVVLPLVSRSNTPRTCVQGFRGF